MSTGPAPAESSAASEPVRRHPALSPGLKQLAFSSAAALAIALVFYFGFFQRHEGWLQSQQKDVESLESRFSQSDQATKQRIDSLKADRESLLGALKQELAEVKQALAESQEATATLRQQANERKSDLAVVRAKATRVRAEAQQARQQLDQLVRERVIWKTKFDPLFADDRGRRIAGSEPHVAIALPVMLRSRASDGDIAGWSTEIDELLQPLNVAQQAKDVEGSVSERHAAAVTSVAKSVRLALDELQRDMRLLETIIQETQSLEMGAATLRGAATALETAEAAKLATAINDSRKAALAAQAETLQKAEQDRIAAETRVKERELANETARLNAREDDLIKQAKEAERQRQLSFAREKLEREFAQDLTEIRRLLSAFIDDGFKRRGRHEGKGPMSFSAIEGAGALQKNSNGRQALAVLVGDSDRPSGPLPRFQGGQTPNQEELCTRAQELLSKYGQLMIEKKMLAE